MTADPLFDFSGKVVLITGGGRGLGLQMARAFAERGADLFLTSRKVENCQAAADEAAKLGRRTAAFRCSRLPARSFSVTLRANVSTVRK